jgi:hypothetical protein
MKWILIITILLSVHILNVQSAKKNGDRVWKNKRQACERLNCNQYLPDESMNCVNNCTSPACFQEIYASNPLEDGEIDDRRSRDFTSCLRRESRTSRNVK